jgi:hypothetical protein
MAAENWSPPISKTFEANCLLFHQCDRLSNKKIWSKITGLKANYNKFLIN